MNAEQRIAHVTGSNIVVEVDPIRGAEEMGFKVTPLIDGWCDIRCPTEVGWDPIAVGGAAYTVPHWGVVIASPTEGGEVIVVNSDGEGIAVGTKGGELVVWQVLNLPESPDTIETPLPCLLKETKDKWIIEEGRRRLDRDDPWEEVVALGHLIRHEETDELQREALVKKLLEGGLLEKKERVLRWANELEDEAASQLAARTDSVLEGLFEELEELRLEYERGETIDVDLLRPVFERRDDAQSAWYLLRQRSRIRETLSPLVEEVDSRGRELVDDYRLEDVRVSSRQLRRASISDARRWWTSLVWQRA